LLQFSIRGEDEAAQSPSMYSIQVKDGYIEGLGKLTFTILEEEKKTSMLEREES